MKRVNLNHATIKLTAEIQLYIKANESTVDIKTHFNSLILIFL